MPRQKKCRLRVDGEIFLFVGVIEKLVVLKALETAANISLNTNRIALTLMLATLCLRAPLEVVHRKSEQSMNHVVKQMDRIHEIVVKVLLYGWLTAQLYKTLFPHYV